MTITENEALKQALSDLISTWGGETPPEAIWSLSSLIDYINLAYGCTFIAPTELEYNTGTFHDEMDEIYTQLDLLTELNFSEDDIPTLEVSVLIDPNNPAEPATTEVFTLISIENNQALFFSGENKKEFDIQVGHMSVKTAEAIYTIISVLEEEL